jgi:hypothetical protein
VKRLALGPIFIATCLFPSLGAAQYGSQNYRPASPAETEAARRATRDVYPQDIRDSPAAHTTTLVAWPGILQRVDSVAGTDSVRLFLEHHYFDWKEDHGRQQELYFLSPRGEGYFSVTIPVTRTSQSGFTGKFSLGALLIVYGNPIGVDTLDGKSVVRVSAIAANAIEPKWYRTDVFSYGRGFSDFHLLKVPD